MRYKIQQPESSRESTVLYSENKLEVQSTNLSFWVFFSFPNSLNIAEHISPSHHLPRQWSNSRGCKWILFRWELCQTCVHESFSTAV